MKLALQILFGTIFAWMTFATIRTSLTIGLIEAIPSYAANPWAMATLYYAYCGFITFYVWVLYKERSLGARLLWFLLIMGLGNIAMSLYVLIQLFRLKPDQPVESMLWTRAGAQPV
jgi:hypothetical protein